MEQAKTPSVKELIQKDAVSAIVSVINRFNDVCSISRLLAIHIAQVPHIQHVAQAAIAKLVGGAAPGEKLEKQAPDELRAGMVFLCDYLPFTG